MQEISKSKQLVRKLKRHPLYRYLAIPRRAVTGARIVLSGVPAYARWLIRSREETNFTYELSAANLLYLSHMLAVVTGAPPEIARRYIDELEEDADLRAFILDHTRRSVFRGVADDRVGYAKRLGWYALVRLTKPHVVVETGVDKGLGSVALCRALLRNGEEGHPGRYIGTDINPEAGWLLQPPFAAVGEIRFGDSIQTLERMTEKVDIFINDSDHSADYEAREYEVIRPKMNPGGVIIGDNAHVTSKLAEFSSVHNRRFLFFKEDPAGHWYPGAGIGFSMAPEP